jgi:hypothetical protein
MTTGLLFTKLEIALAIAARASAEAISWSGVLSVVSCWLAATPTTAGEGVTDGDGEIEMVREMLDVEDRDMDRDMD